MAEEKNTKKTKEFSQARVAGILERGVIITMDNDIRQLKAKGVLDTEESRTVLKVNQAKETKASVLTHSANTEEQQIIQEIRRVARLQQKRKILEIRQRIQQEQERRSHIEKQRQVMLATQEKQKQERLRKQEQEAKERIQQEQEIKEKEQTEEQEEQNRIEQERIKKQEEKRKAKELANKQASAGSLKKEETWLQVELKKLTLKRKPLENKHKKLEKQAQALKAKFGALVKKEHAIQEEKQQAEQAEGAATNPKQLRMAEKRRWLVEKKRRDIEKKRWALETRIKNKKELIQGTVGEIDVFRQKEAKILTRKKQIAWDLKKIELIKEKVSLDDKQRALEHQEERLLEEERRFSEEANEIDQKIKQAIEKEKQIEAQTKAIEDKEETVQETKQTRAQEKARWQVEEKRREIEKARWELESKRSEISKRVKEVEDKKLSISAQGEEIGARAEEIAILLEYGPEQGAKMIAQKNKGNVAQKVEPPLPPKKVLREKVPSVSDEEKRKQKEIESQGEAQRAQDVAKKEEARKLAEIRERAKTVQSQNIKEQPKGPLSKDVILRKLTKISPYEETARKEFLARVEGKEKVDFVATKGTNNRSEVVFRPVIKQPPALEKLLIRLTLLIVVLAILIVGSLWAYSTLKPDQDTPPQNPVTNPPVIPNIPSIPPVSPSTDTDTDTDTTSTDTILDIIIVPEPEESVDLIGVTGAMETMFLTTSEIPILFEVVLDNQENNNGFRQIVFRDDQTKELANLREFLEAFEVDIPSSFASVLESKQATLFFYNTSEAPQFGFAIEVNDQALMEEAMLNWESSIGRDLSELSFTLTNQNLTYPGGFKSVINKGKPFRYINSNLPNFGICYSLLNDYLIFTFSGEAMVVTLNQITQ